MVAGVFFAAVVLTLIAQSDAPPPAAKQAPVKIDTEAPGVTLVERASRKKVCSAPCGELLSTSDTLEYVLQAPGALESDPFTLRDAEHEVTLFWRPATLTTRVFGVGLTVLGGVAVLAAIASSVAALIIGVGCAANGTACPSLTWGYSAIPLAIGGYVVLGIGMTLTFRFGIEKLSLEIAG